MASYTSIMHNKLINLFVEDSPTWGLHEDMIIWYNEGPKV